MQSSLAVSADGRRWFLVNASPDAGRQIERFLRGDSGEAWGRRTSPVAGVLLTNADLDHCLGLFALREGAEELGVWAPEAVRRTVVEGIGIERVLGAFGGVRWREAEDEWTMLDGGALEVRSVALRGTGAPRWAREEMGVAHAVGYLFREGSEGPVVGVFPDVAVIDVELVEVLRGCDRVYFDGTFWTGDEMVALGFTDRDAAAMGHVPMSGADGSLAVLTALPGDCAYLHVNNTNPVLRPDSGARAEIARRGVRLAEDGERWVV